VTIVYLNIDNGDVDLRGTVVPVSVTSQCLALSCYKFYMVSKPYWP